jgi:glycosyltransferase involved in cell wall biosynthesis
MAGQDKGLEGTVKNLARDLGIADHVSFPGYIGWDAKVQALTEADVFLNTSRVDNTPVSVLEACGAGLPVVSTCVGGIPDFLTEGQTALLVSSDNDEEMAGAVLRLLQDPELTSRLSAAGRNMAELSSWGIVHEQWEKLFRAISFHA